MTLQHSCNLVARLDRLAEPGPLPADIFRYEEEPLPEPGEGEVLVEVLVQTIDAGTRAMLEPTTDYVIKLRPGNRVPASATLARVVASRHPGWEVGALVRFIGSRRQRYIALNPDKVLDFGEVPAGVPPLACLGVLGMTGFTAWVGMTEICRVKPGETLVVSAAAGAVGSAAGQFGRMKGARVVGIAGGPDKCARVRGEFGFDECVDYRAGDFAERLAAACPSGIDAYFENVGGAVQRAVFPLLNDFARVAMCGQVAQYSGAGEEPGPNLMPVVLRRLSVIGFLANDHYHRFGEFTREVQPWLASGDVVQAVSVSRGETALHEAINMLASGGNFGQQLHQPCSDETLAEAFAGHSVAPSTSG